MEARQDGGAGEVTKRDAPTTFHARTADDSRGGCDR